jgi:type VI secretion system protein ImpK
MAEHLLLDRFTAFYEALADVKQALADGRLAAFLARDGEEPARDPVELAAALSGYLRQFLENQAKEVRDASTETVCKAYRMAQFVMAALADELLLLEVNWEGREAWLHFLLEQKIFRTSSAGEKFFSYAEALIESRVRDRLRLDLASVFLLALKLGFQGQFRGSQGVSELDHLRRRLLQFINAGQRKVGEEEWMFAQAYLYPLSEKEQSRLAPLRRWYRWGGLALLVYLLLSTGVWMSAVYTFTHSIG